jgi:hypothetical protein
LHRYLHHIASGIRASHLISVRPHNAQIPQLGQVDALSLGRRLKIIMLKN